MRLLDKPHCKKHEVYQQNCIGCRIKNSTVTNAAYFGPDGQGSDIRAIRVRSTEGSDLADTSPKADTKALEAAQANDQSIKQLLKSIYNDGAYGTKRSLQTDLEEIKRLIG